MVTICAQTPILTLRVMNELGSRLRGNDENIGSFTF